MGKGSKIIFFDVVTKSACFNLDAYLCMHFHFIFLRDSTDHANSLLVPHVMYALCILLFFLRVSLAVYKKNWAKKLQTALHFFIFPLEYIAIRVRLVGRIMH